MVSLPLRAELSQAVKELLQSSASSLSLQTEQRCDQGPALSNIMHTALPG